MSRNLRTLSEKDAGTKRMNLEQVAQKAGVSRATVSRVINDEQYVREETRQKVLRVIEEEGYAPNAAARALAKRQTEVIGIVVPDTLENILVNDNPYYYPIVLQGITNAAHSDDYATLLWMLHSSEDERRYYQRILKNRLMDGLLIVASVTTESFLIDELQRIKFPFVIISQPPRSYEGISYVGIDNVAAAQEAVHHLAQLGRKCIGTITGKMHNREAQDRLRGYEQGIKLSGLPYDETLVVEGAFSRDSGYNGMKYLLDQGVDAVFAASDVMAVGALEAIQEAGLHVPEDIAIVGFDDLPLATQVKPTLTTIRQPIAKKAAIATSTLIGLIEGRMQAPVQVLLPTQLVIRNSCGAKQKG